MSQSISLTKPCSTESDLIVEHLAQRLHRYQFIFDTLRTGVLSDGTGYWKDKRYCDVVASLDCPSPEELTEQMRTDKELEMMSMLEQKCRKDIISLEDRLNVLSAAFTLSAYVVTVDMKKLMKEQQNMVMQRYNELRKEDNGFGVGAERDQSFIMSPFSALLRQAPLGIS
ncbi:hypothetical protein D9758_009387 [Tetrapyrgos nigripes]|uniref:Uncharacterized protein n=1 Tax=Tetrapyrgos nigripes TaxID=182062 RepID=A0A8H5D2P1_9AGAR|nr:hypothetical protein D9758_009387 [Tetrapyrgos nigripes]